MSELTNVASKLNNKVNRKDNKQISFRVSESEYLDLERSAKVLNISVPAFVKKKAQGARIVAPKIDSENAKEIARHLTGLGNNTNQIAKRLNSIEYDNQEELESIKKEVDRTLKGLAEIWRQLT
ncbi:plasmid mobilization protein [Lactococcus lactis]|uniref:plasmid mobilization protein n=1 Tax=Lactococcus lactis TaxID=1358 RepID=UPI001255F00C|nr:plasmid mobilization relaxosome protein MobC [Lactococcus lactis]TYR29143.1 MobC family plasmid mobilization relaxosome protein [Lactococcus lactis subsp. lactis bv. diacetylactis]